MTDPTTSILIAGVGGQGILLASEIIAHSCLKAGYDVRKSEAHGSRGGSAARQAAYRPMQTFWQEDEPEERRC